MTVAEYEALPEDLREAMDRGGLFTTVYGGAERWVVERAGAYMFGPVLGPLFAEVVRLTSPVQYIQFV